MSHKHMRTCMHTHQPRASVRLYVCGGGGGGAHREALVATKGQRRHATSMPIGNRP